MNESTTPIPEKWDLSAIYADEDAFFKDYTTVEAACARLAKHEATATRSARELYETLKDACETDLMLEKLWCYASLHHSLNTADGHYQSLLTRVRSLAVRIDNASWYLSPAILRLSEETLARWYEEYPPLITYKRLLSKTYRRRPYMLSDECEELSSRLGDCFGTHSSVRSVLANSDLCHGKVRDEDGTLTELTDANYITFMQSGDRRVRQSAFRTLYKTYGQFKSTFATLYDAAVRERCTLARVRGYKSSLAASTFRDEVTPDIYTALIRSVHKGLPVLYDYYALKRELLGVKHLHMYDLYVPLVKSLDRKYPYAEAVKEVLRTAEVFGKEYYTTLKNGLLSRGWVDVYPSRGKRGGAFSSGTPETEPYILLNYTETFDDISTLAHEAGHSMHSYFSNTYNEPHASGYTIFVAEVASTVNELLFSHRRLKESESIDEKLYILNHLMETYKGTLFRQTMFAEFERDMHALVEKGEPLSAELISAKYRRLVLRYFGKDVVADREIDLEWSRIPHFYNCFYVYKYATCISAASAIVKRIEREGEPYIEKYIEFLKCGDSCSPLESLAVAGIDMTDPAIVDAAIEDFRAALSDFRTLYHEKNAQK